MEPRHPVQNSIEGGAWRSLTQLLYDLVEVLAPDSTRASVYAPERRCDGLKEPKAFYLGTPY